jgi:hypothetical protein
VVLVVELVEAGILSTCLGLHVWPMHQVVPVVELAKRSSQHSFHIVWQKDNEIRQLQKLLINLVNQDMTT